MKYFLTGPLHQLIPDDHQELNLSWLVGRFLFAVIKVVGSKNLLSEYKLNLSHQHHHKLVLYCIIPSHIIFILQIELTSKRVIVLLAMKKYNGVYLIILQ